MRQDRSTKQLNLLHHFLVAHSRLLEKQVHNPHTALVVERLYLLHDGVRPTHEIQRTGSPSHVSLHLRNILAGSVQGDVAGAARAACMALDTVGRSAMPPGTGPARLTPSNHASACLSVSAR